MVVDLWFSPPSPSPASSNLELWACMASQRHQHNGLQAFEDWLGPNKGRSSWDPITVMIAVRGAVGVYCKETGAGGHMTVDESGRETWHDGSGANQSRVEYAGPGAQEAISFELNQLLCKPPGPWSSTTWDLAQGENCYGPRGSSPAHGATDLERPPSASCGSMTLTECQQKCLDLPGCTAITVNQGPDGKYDCYRKADVSIDHCDSGTSLSTYVRREWLLAGGFNCYEGHGATSLDKSSCGSMTVRSCQEKCAEMRGCSGVVWAGKAHSGEGNCYRKANISLSRCVAGTAFDTYLAAGTFR